MVPSVQRWLLLKSGRSMAGREGTASERSWHRLSRGRSPSHASFRARSHTLPSRALLLFLPSNHHMSAPDGIDVKRYDRQIRLWGLETQRDSSAPAS